MAMDPVCNMEVDEATAQWTTDYKGKTYYFCAPGCKASFDDDPEKYLGDSGSQESHEGHMNHEGHEAHEGHMDHDHSHH